MTIVCSSNDALVGAARQAGVTEKGRVVVVFPTGKQRYTLKSVDVDVQPSGLYSLREVDQAFHISDRDVRVIASKLAREKCPLIFLRARVLSNQGEQPGHAFVKVGWNLRLRRNEKRIFQYFRDTIT